MLLVGKANSNGVTVACKIKTVILTNESGGTLGLALHPTYNADIQTPIRITAANGTTQQIFIDEPFPNGFRIVPDANLTLYMVTYEPIPQVKE